jgi:hypothetical protein
MQNPASAAANAAAAACAAAAATESALGATYLGFTGSLRLLIN